MDKSTLRATLVALFDLARANLPATVARVGGRTGLGDELARRALAELERDGLADARTVRLTLVGLAVAARIAEQRDLVRAEPARPALAA